MPSLGLLPEVTALAGAVEDGVAFRGPVGAVAENEGAGAPPPAAAARVRSEFPETWLWALKDAGSRSPFDRLTLTYTFPTHA